MALRGTLLEKAVLLGVPLAAGGALVVAAVMVKGTYSRPPDVVFEGKLSPGGTPAPASSGAVTRDIDTTPPTITDSTPAPGTTADTDFTDVVITFSENIDPATLNPSTVLVWRSGGDGIFFNGNEVQITPDTIELIDATHARVVLPSGLPVDTYRVYLLGYPQATSATTTSSSSGFSASNSTSTSTSASTSTGQNTTATTSNSTSSTSSSSTTSSNSSSTTTTATSGATSSATTSSSTTSASSNSTTSASSNTSSASTSSASSASTTSGAPPPCSDSGGFWPVANSSSGNGYFGG